MCQAFLAETVETGTKNRCVIDAPDLTPHMFCEENVLKIRAFPKRVDPRILSLESVDYFEKSEHY